MNSDENVKVFATRFDGSSFSIGSYNEGTSAIDINNLASGSFIISVVSNSGIESTKITVLK